MKDGRVKNFSDVPDYLQVKPKDMFSGKDFEYETGYAATTLTWTRRLSGKESSIGIIVNIEDEPYVRVNYTITDRNTGKKTDYENFMNIC